MPISKRSPLALAILVLLDEAPMHTYRMQQLIKERGKAEVINVTQRNSLYQTIARLEREGQLKTQAVLRDRKRPERTVYKITPAGKASMLKWTRQILSTPSREFPEFPAAVSMLAVLTPKDALWRLEGRTTALKTEIARLDGIFATWSFLPRLFLVEFEYLRAQISGELRWVQGITADLRTGRLTWKRSLLKTTRGSGSQIWDRKAFDSDKAKKDQEI